MFEVGWTGPHTPKFNVGFRAVSCTDMPLTHHEKETDRLFVNGPTGQASLRALTALEGERPTQPQKRQRPSKYIVPKVENFKRSKAGSRLVRQEVLKLVDEQARLCPGKVMRTIDGKNVRYSSSGRVESITLDVLLEKAPGFFSSFFGGVRRKLEYGAKVQEWLSSDTRFCIFRCSLLERLEGSIISL